MADPAPLATLLYAPNDAKADVLATFAARRHAEGVALDGLLVETVWLDDKTKVGLQARALAADRRIALTRPYAEGIVVGRWQLLPQAIAETEAVLAAAVARPAELLIVDKFGPLEGRGGGLAAPLAAALSSGIPLLVAVRREFAPAWQAFVAARAPARLAGEARLESGDAAALEDWWQGVRDRLTARA